MPYIQSIVSDPTIVLNPTDSTTNTITSGGTSVTPLTLKAYSGQTANIIDVKNSSNTTLFSVDTTKTYISALKINNTTLSSPSSTSITVSLPSSTGTLPLLGANQSWGGENTFNLATYFSSGSYSSPRISFVDNTSTGFFLNGSGNMESTAN